MAKFTFRSGNARALLRAPLYAAGSIATRFVPRQSDLWVFGSGIGPGEGALALHDLAARTLPDHRLVWLCGSEDELRRARALGMTAALKSSWRGFRLTLRAGVLVITHGFGDVNRYAVPGSFVVQLWHGIPLKKLHLDTAAALSIGFLPDHPLLRRALGTLYRRAAAQISLFPAASALAAGRLASAFGIGPGVLAVTGDPRNDVLLRGTPEHRRAEARRTLEDAVGTLPPTVLLYAPTWRDGKADPGVPSAREWTAIGAWLEAHDAALLLRSHPLGLGEYAAGPALSARIRLLDPTSLPDVNPALSAVDILVTDYSSIAFDFALTGGPVLFFAPDLDRYIASRGLYEPYREFTGNTHVSDWSSLLALAAEARTDERLLAHASRLKTEHFDFDDGRATERVLVEILTRRNEAVPAALSDALEKARPRLVIDHVELSNASPGEQPELTLGGPERHDAPLSVRLVGSRLSLEATITRTDAGWRATVPLTAARWGGPQLAPPSGTYRLRFAGATVESSRVDVVAPAIEGELTSWFRMSVSTGAGALDVTFSAPLAADEIGSRNQRSLELRYRLSRPTPEAAVFFESFYGRVAACNPRALDARLAQERPDITRYWSTVDASVAVPEGATRIIEGSARWWEVRAAARLLVVNDWLRKRYRRRSHQRVLQTWHGTMLKRLALDRARPSVRARIAVLRERARWDILLSQNPHSTRTFRSAYRFRRQIWEDGYPRDDALVSRDGAAIRQRLGIPEGQRILLYAPTWRDDRTELVDYLDLPRFAAELGEQTVTLVRGHSRTIPYGRNFEGPGLVDVTTYPDVTDLLLVADVLITDYSSVMFDFTATGKPIVLFTPDLRHYSEDLRGFYFDLIAEAPGPVARTRNELVAALATVETDAPVYHDRYVAWHAQFNPHDDGKASERVVRRIIDAGMLD